MPTRCPSLRRHLGAALTSLVVALLAGLATPGAAGAQAPDDPTVTTAPIAPPAASIVVDADTGAVISASNERTPLPPASTTKLLTVLMAQANLGLDTDIGISRTASIAPPRRIGLRPGTVWGVDDLSYAAIHCSCNDAAWALGQAAGGGSMAGFEAQAGTIGAQLGLADGPVVRDPAGLDDDRSVRGGNLISARDLAIIGRAYLADPELAAIAQAPGHEWVGGDGKPHTVTNRNAFLGRYEGAVGLKTGSTQKAGLTFVAAAERGGRSLIAVVLGSDAHYADARALLDAGFLLAEATGGTGDVLPPLPEALGAAATTTTTTTTTPTTPSTEAATSPSSRALPSTEAAPAPTPATDDDEALPVAALLGGSFVVGLGVGAGALGLRRRARRDQIDRRPARARRRRRRGSAARFPSDGP